MEVPSVDKEHWRQGCNQNPAKHQRWRVLRIIWLFFIHLLLFRKRSILAVSQGSEYACGRNAKSRNLVESRFGMTQAFRCVHGTDLIISLFWNQMLKKSKQLKGL